MSIEVEIVDLDTEHLKNFTLKCFHLDRLVFPMLSTAEDTLVVMKMAEYLDVAAAPL